MRLTKVIQLAFQLYQLNISTNKATAGPLWAIISIFHALKSYASNGVELFRLTKDSISWQRRPSASGRKKRSQEDPACPDSSPRCSPAGRRSAGLRYYWIFWEYYCSEARTPEVLAKNGEINLTEPNQIASSVPIVTELSYFFLDQWGINIHLLCKKCFNIPHLSRSLSSTIEGSPHKFDHRPSITFTESPITVHTDQSSPGAAGEVWGCLELPGHLCFSEPQCWIKGKTCGEVLSSLPFWANRMKKKIKFVKVFKEAISVNLIWIFVLVETKCSRTSACVDKV